MYRLSYKILIQNGSVCSLVLNDLTKEIMMKITSIDLIAIESILGESFCPVVTRIHTDEGISGIGEAGMAILNGSKAVFGMLKDYAPLLIGKNPLDHSVIWENLFRDTFWAMSNGPVVMSSISALDTALWDIKAKALGVPLYQALGGKYRDKIHAYASQLHFNWGGQDFDRIGSLDAYRESALRAKEQGYDAVKVNFLAMDEQGRTNPNASLKNTLSPQMLRTAEERIRVVREVMGPDALIVAENNGNTDVTTAIQFAQMAEPYGILYLEEPCMPLSAANYQRIASSTTIPIAAGERIFTRWGFRPFLEQGAISVAQPDIGNCGGVTEFMRIAAMCQVYDVSVQSHACNSPISVAVALHLEAAVPNFIIHEHHITNTFDKIRKMGIYDYQPVNSYIDVPNLPGIGQDLSDFAMSHATVYTIS